MASAIKHLSEDGATQITQKVWPDAFAGINQMSRKFAFENIGDRQLNGVSVSLAPVGVSDGSLEMRLALDTQAPTLSTPYAVTLVLSAPGAGGVWASTGVRGYKITALNALGETIASVEATINVDVTTKTVTVSWTTIPGATSYKVYRTDTPGTYVSPALRANPAAPPFIDTGAAVGAGAPPTVNTTAGWFTTLVLSGAGAGGVWSGTGNQFYRVAALDSTGALLATSIEATVNVDDTTKTVTVSWVAVPGAASYNVYRSTVSGVYTSPALRANVVASPFVDVGGAVTAGTLTEAPSYGIPPATGSFGTSALAIGAVPINQQIFYWVNRVVPAATPETGNPRVGGVKVKES